MTQHYDLIIRGGTLVLPSGLVEADVAASGGRIVTIAPGPEATAEEVIDAHGLHVLPGLIDAHTHLRDNPEVETIATGTRAAILGGLTTVFDMPNGNPSITSTARLEATKDFAATRSWCDLGLYVGAARTNIPDLAALELEEGVCAIKVFAGSSTGDLLVESDELLEAVMRSGRRRIAFLDAPPEYAFSDARRRGYLRALEAHGAPVDASLVVPGSTAVEESVAIADALLALPSPPTAIFAWNDDLAACALIAAHRRGLDIPADLAVAGFDDNDLATKVWPALTTVHQPIDAMAALAVERLVEHVRGREVEWPQHVTVDHKIIRRQSTATPAAPAAPHLRPQ